MVTGYCLLGLCHNNLTQSPDEKFPTTCEDLQGFWDMVMLQVNHIDELFKEIEEIKKNNWTVNIYCVTVVTLKISLLALTDE